jgi:hypothetical protein
VVHGHLGELRFAPCSVLVVWWHLARTGQYGDITKLVKLIKETYVAELVDKISDAALALGGLALDSPRNHVTRLDGLTGLFHQCLAHCALQLSIALLSLFQHAQLFAQVGLVVAVELQCAHQLVNLALRFVFAELQHGVWHVTVLCRTRAVID